VSTLARATETVNGHLIGPGIDSDIQKYRNREIQKHRETELERIKGDRTGPVLRDTQVGIGAKVIFCTQ